MTGNEIIKIIKTSKGTVYATVSGVDDPIHIQIVKADAVAQFMSYGDRESGFQISQHSSGSFFIERAN